MPAKHFLFTIDADWLPGSQVGLEAVLDLCDELGIRATIFATGKFALAYPELIRQACRAHHEIGTHGWQHPLPTQTAENYRLTPVVQRREWLARATDAISVTVGRRPIAFRAPFLWTDGATFRLLEESGYTIDSSIPTRRFDGLVGVVNYRDYFWADLNPYHPDLDAPARRGPSRILEMPPSAFFVPLNMSGLRFFGLPCMLLVARLVSRRTAVLNFYCHPWEFVPTSALQLPPGGPARHLHGTGPHLLKPLRAFIEAVLSAGHVAGTVSEVAACGW